MASGRHYANAPITEALIDIQVELAPGATISSLDAVYECIKNDYPTRKNRMHIEGQFLAGEQVGASARQTRRGYIFYASDGRQIVQARLDGFTFSRLKPYQNWSALRDEARRLWSIYRKSANPLKMTRVAARYINQIDIPLPVKDFKDYLRTIPEISPELPQHLSGFLMQLQIPQADFGGLLILTETMVPPANPDVVSVILDIDVFKEAAGLILDEDVWRLLELLRERKNQVFEGCITDKARELFGPAG